MPDTLAAAPFTLTVFPIGGGFPLVADSPFTLTVTFASAALPPTIPEGGGSLDLAISMLEGTVEGFDV